MTSKTKMYHLTVAEAGCPESRWWQKHSHQRLWERVLPCLFQLLLPPRVPWLLTISTSSLASIHSQPPLSRGGLSLSACLYFSFISTHWLFSNYVTYTFSFPSTGQWDCLQFVHDFYWFSSCCLNVLPWMLDLSQFSNSALKSFHSIPPWSFCKHFEEFIKSSFVSLFVSCPSRSMSLPASWGHS